MKPSTSRPVGREIAAALITALILPTLAFAQEKAETGLATRLMKDVRWLCAPEQRGRGPEEGARIAGWIEARFRAAGLRPAFGESYVQRFNLTGFAGFNVAAILPGEDWPKSRRHVIVSAHHDHLGIRRGRLFPGAADNAAGVAAMLWMAETLAREAPRKASILFLGFDREEQGMWGARAYARAPALPLADLVTFTTMDILGRGVADLPGRRLVVLGWERSPELLPLVDAAAATVPDLELLRLGADVVGDRSDYVPFRNRGIPFLFLTTGEFRDYHRTRDTPDRLDAEALAAQARFSRALVERLATREEPPPYQRAAALRTAEGRDYLRLLEALEAHKAKLPPALAERVSRARKRTAGELADGMLSGEERARLKASVRRLMIGLRRR